MKISAIARKSVLVVFLILLAGIFVWLLCIIFQPLESHYQEPEYGGKKLTDWAKGIDQNAFFGHPIFPKKREQSELAIAAIRHIGTNALPVVLDLLTAKDSWFKVKLEEFAQYYDYHDWPNQRRHPIYIKSADEKQFEGVNIICALGSAAKPIIPDLIRLLENQDRLYDETMTALLGAGTNAIPPLIELLNSTNQAVRLRAAIVFGNFFRPKMPSAESGGFLIAAGSEDFRPEARAAVPVLLQYLENPNQNLTTRASVIYSLILIHEDASIVVPAILRLMQSQTNNWMFRGYIQILGNYGTNAKPAVPMLVHILESKSKWPHGDYSPLKISALIALSRIGSEGAKPAVPVMLHILESKPQWPDGDYSALKISALFTLSKVDPQAAKPFVPRLLHILELKSDWPGGYAPGQIFALVALWRVDPKAAQPFFEKWKPNQDWIAGDLERIDPEATKPFMEKWKASLTNASAEDN
ncbi:MAG: HEAT repeat domain-containing protein [Limisphaerales bacterium]